MSIEKSVLKRLLKLPVDKQKEVLAFLESLEKQAGHRHRPSLKDLWADLGWIFRRKTLPRRAAKSGEDFPERMFDGRCGRRHTGPRLEIVSVHASSC
jgi:hypothetical protein